ncbi:MAG: hypothetical protein WDZ41_02865 [Candidatus Babeliales bacterium]
MKVKFFQALFIIALLFIHNAKANSNQYFIDSVNESSLTETDEALNLFCIPIKFTKSGIKCFLKHTFSRNEYSEFLSHDFFHLIEFLQYGKDSHQNTIFLQSTIRLFCNKVKGCNYVSADAFSNTIERFPALLETYFVRKPTSIFTEAKNTIKRLLYSTFLSKFVFFKEDPDNFFDGLSGDIIEALNNTSFIQKHIDNEQLRQSVLKFLEITLNKVIWTPLDQEEVWHSVKNISYKLEELEKSNIINQDELDDLFQSLLCRFIHFLDIAGSDLSTDAIALIKKDIDEGKLLFLTLEEQEEFIEPKIARLKRTLQMVETRIIAQSRGLVPCASI